MNIHLPPLSNRSNEDYQTKNQWLLRYFIFRESNDSQSEMLELISAMGKNSSYLANRYRGCLLGLAIGDAFGTTLEFSQRKESEDHVDMIGGGPFNLRAGQWTDDTSMALCLGYSLLEKKTFSPKHQMELYVKWWKEGLFSSTRTCFDIGHTTAAALGKFIQTEQAYSGPTDERSAGNGSLMRLAPIPLFFSSIPSEAIKLAGESSKTTHGAVEAVDACRYMAALIIGILYGEDKETILSSFYTPQKNHWDFYPLCSAVEEIARGRYKSKSRDAIKSTGYVIDSLEAALWAFHQTSTFEEGLIKAVNLGGDSDTIGAIYGQLAGAYYGETGIPFKFISKLFAPHYFYYMADELCMYYAGDPVLS